MTYLDLVANDDYYREADTTRPFFNSRIILLDWESRRLSIKFLIFRIIPSWLLGCKYNILFLFSAGDVDGTSTYVI